MIIGITGTNGAGKGELAKYLVEEKGFKHYSVRDYLVKRLEKEGLNTTRDNMIILGNELRHKHGPSYIVEELFKEAIKNGGDSVIESIRTLGEAMFIKDKGGKIWAVDAQQKLRYERVLGRGSSTDDITFDKFIENEKREMSSSDPNNQNIQAVVEVADKVFANNGTLQELLERVDKELKNV